MNYILFILYDLTFLKNMILGNNKFKHLMKKTHNWHLGEECTGKGLDRKDTPPCLGGLDHIWYASR